ncbi:MAG: nucleotidyltransferase family protein [Planctomycetaceae bacterium]
MVIALVEQNLDELGELCRAYRVRRLDLFGSAATADAFDPQRSDLDFLVEFEPEQDLGPWLRHYFDFQRALTELMGRPVDLVMDSALKNPHFIREVQRTRTTLYAS